MKRALLLIPMVLASLSACQALSELALPETNSFHTARHTGFVVLPSPTNAVQFRLYTNGAPHSAHLFNTFELEAYGEVLLRSPGGEGLQRWLGMSPTNPVVHSLLVNGVGPQLASTNGLTMIEQAQGSGWRYLAFDASAAYRGRLTQYKRSVLFVEPDLFILHDHLVASQPASFQMILHPPAATRVDKTWGDLRLESSKAAFRIHAPAEKKKPRNWERVPTSTDALFPGTVTMQLGPTNTLTELDLVTVFAVQRGGEKRDLAFRLLESPNAVGARIHREGLPTLVAFKTDPAVTQASLAGFPFTGPVGVDVFRPKQKVR